MDVLPAMSTEESTDVLSVRLAGGFPVSSSELSLIVLLASIKGVSSAELSVAVGNGDSGCDEENRREEELAGIILISLIVLMLISLSLLIMPVFVGLFSFLSSWVHFEGAPCGLFCAVCDCA